MKRYKLTPVNVADYYNDAFYMAIKEIEDPMGDWVKYADVEALLEKLSQGTGGSSLGAEERTLEPCSYAGCSGGNVNHA